MLRVSPGQLGCVYASQCGRHWSVFVCVCVCILVCVRCRSNREGLNIIMIISTRNGFVRVCARVSACCWATWKHLVQHNRGSSGIVSRCVCVFWPHWLFDSELTSLHVNHLHCAFCFVVLHLWSRYLFAAIFVFSFWLKE